MRVLWTWMSFRPESYYERDIWRTTWRHAGGGVLMNQASHDLALISWMIGKPVQVSALIGNQLHKAEVEDVVCANVLFDNGGFGSIQLTINQPGIYNVRQVAGEKGVIVMQDVKSLTSDQNDQILLGTYESVLPTMVAQLPGISHRPRMTWQGIGLPENPSAPSVLMDSFVDAIVDGGEPVVSGESARPSIELINAIILSVMRKKVVDLPLDREEYDALFGELSSGKVQIPRFR